MKAQSPPARSAPVAQPPAGADVGLAIRRALRGDWEAHYFSAGVDPNGDGRQEVVAYVAGPMVCGTGGCPLLVFEQVASGYRLVTAICVVQPPVRVSSQRSNGWRNLVVGIGGGGINAGHTELKFGANGYPANPTVPPAEPVVELDGTEVLIAAFTSFRDGVRVADAGTSSQR